MFDLTSINKLKGNLTKNKVVYEYDTTVKENTFVEKFIKKAEDRKIHNKELELLSKRSTFGHLKILKQNKELVNYLKQRDP
jgi:hypothetical protein